MSPPNEEEKPPWIPTNSLPMTQKKESEQKAAPDDAMARSILSQNQTQVDILPDRFESSNKKDVQKPTPKDEVSTFGSVSQSEFSKKSLSLRKRLGIPKMRKKERKRNNGL